MIFDMFINSYISVKYIGIKEGFTTNSIIGLKKKMCVFCKTLCMYFVIQLMLCINLSKVYSFKNKLWIDLFFLMNQKK